MTRGHFLATPLAAILAATTSSAALPLESKSEGLAWSGRYFVHASFDGHDDRCLLDTGATSSDVAGTYYQAYKRVGRAGRLSASRKAETDEEIEIGRLRLGTFEAEHIRVARHKAGDGALTTIGMDVLGDHPFALHTRPKPTLSWVIGPRPAQHTLHRYHGILALPVNIGGSASEALWDTGAGLSCVSPAMIARHPDNFVFVQDIDKGRDGTGHPITMKLYNARRIGVGPQVFDDLAVLAIDFTAIHEHLSPHVDMILGYNAVIRADWDFDPRHGTWDLHRS